MRRSDYLEFLVKKSDPTTRSGDPDFLQEVNNSPIGKQFPSYFAICLERMHRNSVYAAPSCSVTMISYTGKQFW